MGKSAPSLRYFILGLLTHKPMSGYDIKTFLKDLSWLIDVPSYGSLYPALHALLEKGMVTVEVVPSEGKPARKIYSITHKGGDALQTWIKHPISPGASIKEFATHLILANNFSQDDLVNYLNQRHEQVSEHCAALNEQEHSGEAENVGQRLVLNYGLEIAHAELLWLERVLSRLGKQSKSVTKTPELLSDVLPVQPLSVELDSRT